MPERGKSKGGGRDFSIGGNGNWISCEMRRGTGQMEWLVTRLSLHCTTFSRNLKRRKKNEDM